MDIILETDLTLTGPDYDRYAVLDFRLPQQASRLELSVAYARPGGGRIYPVLVGPDGLRGFSMGRVGRERRTLELVIAETEASPGCVAGPLPTGDYRLTLDPMALSEDTPVSVRVMAEFGRVAEHRPSPFPEPVIRTEAGWYRGELHAHTHHSDGVNSTADLVAAAREVGLDFLTLTDHFTHSGWHELAHEQTQANDIALIRGLELTSHKGHANLLGLSRWVDTLIDSPARGVNDVIADTHAQGGLFSVNHSFSNTLGWQRHDTDWAEVDLLEVYHHLEHNHNILQVGYWDGLLNQGYAVVGVGATDSHNAFSGRHRLGQAVSVVYADELSERGIIAGLRRGNVYATLGPALDFFARQNGATARMFETVAVGERVMLEVAVSELNRPAALFVIKNGLYHSRTTMEPGAHQFTFEDLPEGPSFYRVELHAVPHYAANPNTLYRSWDTFLVAANPIFAGASFAAGRWK